MEVYLLRQDDGSEDAADLQLLKMSGYDGISSRDVEQSSKSKRVRQRIQVCTILNCCPSHMRVVVLHPSAQPIERTEMIMLCRSLGTPCVDWEELPNNAPGSVAELKDVDLCRRVSYARSNEQHTTPSLGDLLSVAYRLLLHWEAQVNAWFGDSLKNPVSCELRKRPVEYRLNTTTTTTG